MEKPLNNWVWKINGIIILLAGIAALAVALFTVYEIFLRKIEPDPVVNLADDPKGIEKWRLGRGQLISGTDYLMLSLISENKEVSNPKPMPVISSGKRWVSRPYYSSAKNILFLNIKTNQSSWLFNTTSQLITATTPFPYFDSERLKEVPPKVIFYSIVTKDTNGDGILNEQDSFSLAMSNTDGSNFQIIIPSFKRIISEEMSGSDKAIIVFQDKETVYSMLFMLKPYKLVSQVKLPRIEQP